MLKNTKPVLWADIICLWPAFPGVRPLLSLLQKIVNIERVESPSPHFTLQAVHLEKPCRCSVPTASWLWKSLHMCTQHDRSQRSVMTRTCHFRARHRGGTVKVWKREKVDRSFEIVLFSEALHSVSSNISSLAKRLYRKFPGAQ